jgi:hypothetical protein
VVKTGLVSGSITTLDLLESTLLVLLFLLAREQRKKVGRALRSDPQANREPCDDLRLGTGKSDLAQYGRLVQ